MTDSGARRPGDRVAATGTAIARWALVLVLAWIGAGKYVKMDAAVLIDTSPLMSWLFDVLSVQAVAVLLGTAEIAAAALIALGARWPALGVAGGGFAVVLFLGTISFLFTAPNVIVAVVNGLPVLSGQPGQFLLKDTVLIGVSVTVLGQSWSRWHDSVERRSGDSRSREDGGVPRGQGQPAAEDGEHNSGVAGGAARGADSCAPAGDAAATATTTRAPSTPPASPTTGAG